MTNNPLDKNTWYWVSNPQEGDIFHPCYVDAKGGIILDDSIYKYEDVKDVTFHKALLPDKEEEQVNLIRDLYGLLVDMDIEDKDILYKAENLMDQCESIILSRR